MPRPSSSWRRPATLATALAGVLLLVGVLVWFVPYLTRKEQWPAGTPDPSALFALAEYPLKEGQKACVSDITIEKTSRLAQVELRPVNAAKHLGPPVELVLEGEGYRGVMHVPGGYPGGSAALPIEPPPNRTVLGSACFINRGHTEVLLDGTEETRTLSRSTTLVDGVPKPGDIALTFIDSRPRSLLSSLGEVFEHASNLTDRLIPVWLVWVIALLVALGVPTGVLAALQRALREDEATGAL
jgi:hypothetical protein